MKSDSLNGVMAGAGFFAGFQAEAWRRIPGVRLSAVADSDAEKARLFALGHGIPSWYGSVAEMIEREHPDFLDVVTRPESHLDLVRLAAARGVAVICQKPMAPDWSDCLAMCAAADEGKVRLLVHENWRWQPWYREAKRLLEAGHLGRMFQVGFLWRTGDGRGPEPYPHQPYFRTMPRLLVYETLVHILDTFRFLAGEVDRLTCRLGRINPAIAGEDHALIELQFHSGSWGMIDANRISGPRPPPVAMGTLSLEGDEGSLRVAPDGRLWLTRYGTAEREHPFAVPPQGYKGDSVWATQVHLSDCLRTGALCESEGREYLKTVQLVEACYARPQPNLQP